jgi:glycosyltransferase involved in cell wall biosynthesis
MEPNKVATIYARGVDAPFTEGHIVMARSIARAVGLCGWRAQVLNFNYPTQGHLARAANSRQLCYEIRMPGIPRERIIHSVSKFSATSILAAALESVLIPVLLNQELRARPSVVHLINCFRLPRALLRLLNRTPVLAHIYQSRSPSRFRFPLPFDAFIASSSRVAENLKSNYANHYPVFTLPPAADPVFFRTTSSIQPRKKVMLYLGNLSRNRFPDRLLESFRQILQRDPEVSLRIISPLNPRSTERAGEIIKVCRSLGIQNRVDVMLRHLSNSERISEYSASRLLVFAPMVESYESIEPPLTVLEALACGLPVLTTNAYSVGEAVTSGQNGYIVDMEDHPRLVERAIEMLEASPVRWKGWSAEARKIAAEKFSLNSASRRLAEIHSRILE